MIETFLQKTTKKQLWKALIDEVLFFYTHWLCHANVFLYQKVHKIHHLHSAPFAITADYAHWFEEILVNIFPQ